MVCRWSQSQEGHWARPHLCKLARHGPWPVRKWLIRDHVWRGRSKPDCRNSRVDKNSVVDHRSWRPVLCPLRNRQMSCMTILGVEMQAVDQVDAQRHQHTQANVDGFRWLEACCQLPLYDVIWITSCYKTGGDSPHRPGPTPLLRVIGCVWRARRLDASIV